MGEKQNYPTNLNRRKLTPPRAFFMCEMHCYMYVSCVLCVHVRGECVCAACSRAVGGWCGVLWLCVLRVIYQYFHTSSGIQRIDVRQTNEA